MADLPAIPETLGGCKIIDNNDRCHHCASKPATPLQTCAVCNWAKYCNRECQEKHWKIHKLECKELARSPEDVRENGISMYKFNHAREMIEMMTRAAHRSKLNANQTCVNQIVDKWTLEHRYWIFDEAMDNVPWTQFVFRCVRDG